MNPGIRHEILLGKPLVKPDGPFTAEQLGDYLDVLEGLTLNYERGLVDLQSLDDWHGYTIAKTYEHPEVLAYIREQQREEETFYAGFVDLGKRLSKDSTGRTTTIKRVERR